MHGLFFFFHMLTLEPNFLINSNSTVNVILPQYYHMTPLNLKFLLTKKCSKLRVISVKPKYFYLLLEFILKICLLNGIDKVTDSL